MENNRKVDFDKGPFGLPIAGLTAIMTLGSLPVSWLLEAMNIIRPGFDGDTNWGPTYLMGTAGILIEWGYLRWKQKKRLDSEE
ncbi:hypothetical protein [Rhizobium wuzhouense]|nr:hypothetical protein [Rhizobium wuzhouense]